MAINSIVPALAGLAIVIGLQMSTPCAAAGVVHNIVGIYANNSGTKSNVEIKSGTLTTVDEATITCPEDTCTLVLSAMQSIQDGEGSVTNPNNPEWAISATVDGKHVQDGPSGPIAAGGNYQGFEPGQWYITGNWQWNTSVKKGTHTVAFKIYTNSQCLLNQWADTVMITTP